MGPQARPALAWSQKAGRHREHQSVGSALPEHRFASGDVLRGAGQALNTRPYLGPTSSPTPPGTPPGRHGTPFTDLFDFSHGGALGELQTHLGELDAGSTPYLQRFEGGPIQGLTPDPLTQDTQRLSKPWP